MAHKLWEKNFEVNKEIERFTVGRDRELDIPISILSITIGKVLRYVLLVYGLSFIV